MRKWFTRSIGVMALGLAVAGCTDSAQVERAQLNPSAQLTNIPVTRWDHRPDGAEWTQAAMSALQSHGASLATLEPKDVDTYCPGYRTASAEDRMSFWAGLISGLAKHESTWREEAIGGGNQWFGLLQISPATARGYGCNATSGQALLNGESNLSCGIRIMGVTVPRDNAIAVRDSRWRGIAADWAPFQSSSKRAEIAAWTKQQPYCQVKPEKKGLF